MATYSQNAGLLNSLPDVTDLRELLQLLPTDDEMAALANDVTDADLETLVENSLYGRSRVRSFQEHYKNFLGIFRPQLPSS